MLNASGVYKYYICIFAQSSEQNTSSHICHGHPRCHVTQASISTTSPKLARDPRQHATHASTPPMQARQHGTLATLAGTPPIPPSLARRPRKHATHASTPPTQVHHPRHPRQHVYHAISQTLYIRYNKKFDEQLIDKCLKADRKTTVLIRTKDYLDINKQESYSRKL